MTIKKLIPAALVATAFSIGGVALANTNASAPAPSMAAAEVGKAAPAFTLEDTDGKNVSLSDFKGKVVVLEWFCAQCPWSGKASRNSVHSTGQVRDLVSKLKKADPDVVYLVIDSSGALMPKDKLTKTDAGLKRKFGIEGPLLIDWNGKVGKAYGAKTTPHMYVIDEEGILRYQGAFGDHKKTNYVLNAVTAIENGSTVEPTYVKQWGCGVKYK